jgi:hypothetical protein
MGRNASGTDMPEFHIVVRRPARLGPIAPYRFAIAVAVAIAVTFGELRAAIFDGAPADEVLVRALVAAGFTWIMLTVLNRVLAAAPPEPTAPPSDPDF